MKLATLLAAALLPAGLMAAPAGADDADPRDGGLRREEVSCEIVNASTTVNCRKGPGTKYDVVAAIPKGTVRGFTCVKTGECITDNKKVNCGWDHMYYFGVSCYINGHYTDSECTLDRLGRCP